MLPSNAAALPPRPRRLGVMLACAVIGGLLVFALSWNRDIVEVYGIMTEIAIAPDPNRPGVGQPGQPPMLSELNVRLLNFPLLQSTVPPEDLPSRVLLWKWTMAAAFYVAGAVVGLLLGLAISRSVRRNAIVLSMVVGLLLGGVSQIAIMVMSLVRAGDRGPDRFFGSWPEFFADNILMIVLCALGGGAAGLLGASLRGAIGGALAGGLGGFLLARVALQFTSGVEGLVRGEIVPLVVIVGGPVVGAIAGGILKDWVSRA